MIYFEIELDRPITYNLTGKFQAPSNEWAHFSRQLGDFELIVVTDGTAYLQLDEQCFEIKTGDFLLFPPNSKQTGYKPSSCAFYWLHFNCTTPPKFVNTQEIPANRPEDMVFIPQYGKLENLEKIVVIMKHLQDSVRSYGSKLQNNYISTSILCEIFNQQQKYIYPEYAYAKRKQLFNDIQDYIKWNRNLDIKVAEIAEHFGYNKRYLSEFFKNLSGYSIKEYIIQEKLDLAKYLLCETNDNINEIAYSLGFCDSHSFMKLFKKSLGLTPTQYRNAYSKRLLYYK